MSKRPPRARRVTVERDLALIMSDGAVLRVRLKDISKEGFKFEHSGEDFEAGDIVTIGTGRGVSRAQILWASDSEAGGTFIEPPTRSSNR